MPQFSDDLFLGAAQSYAGINANSNLGNPAPMDLGFGPMGRVYLYDVTPSVGTVAAVLTAKTPTGAITYSGTQLAAASATAGTSQVVRTDGTTVVQLDYPRAVAVTTAAGSPTNSVITITGYDYYGNVMTEIIQSGTVASTQTVGRKAFFQVFSVAFSAATTVAVSVDTNSALGLPARISDASYVLTNKASGALAADAGTFVQAFYGNTTNYSNQAITNFTAATPGVVTVAYSPASGTPVQFTGALGTLTGVSLNTTYIWTNLSATTGRLSTNQTTYLAGTFVATGGTTITSGLTLVPQFVSSAITPDIRGTYTPAATLNGKLRLVLTLGLTGIQVGPNATATGLLGIAQA
jgi:hypothetical protein